MAEPEDRSGDMPVEQQAREQTGQRQVRVQVDERDLRTCYANMFRTNGTADEVMLDFGLSLAPAGRQDAERPEILFKVTQRVILNYHSAKRLAITLSQVIRRYEQQFGELELDVSKRRRGGA